ncbi:MAG: hypothetical protein BRD29_00375 [Bacteroidetes bacterium QH_2_67_10]|nr:MAG: hypothetical protein BRD29_00375 [Bacteroidetes bacterium QH_2_67_10]
MCARAHAAGHPGGAPARLGRPPKGRPLARGVDGADGRGSHLCRLHGRLRGRSVRAGRAVAVGALGGAALMFGAGLTDDLRGLSPAAKLIAQLGATLLLLYAGYAFGKGGPYWLYIPFTFLWVIGITNAVNLLDNMDGLAAGIASIAAFVLAVYAAMAGGTGSSWALGAVGGAAAGFLVYNFKPARIFMDLHGRQREPLSGIRHRGLYDRRAGAHQRPPGPGGLPRLGRRAGGAHLRHDAGDGDARAFGARRIAGRARPQLAPPRAPGPLRTARRRHALRREPGLRGAGAVFLFLRDASLLRADGLFRGGAGGLRRPPGRGKRPSQ